MLSVLASIVVPTGRAVLNFAWANSIRLVRPALFRPPLTPVFKEFPPFFFNCIISKRQSPEGDQGRPGEADQRRDQELTGGLLGGVYLLRYD